MSWYVVQVIEGLDLLLLVRGVTVLSPFGVVNGLYRSYGCCLQAKGGMKGLSGLGWGDSRVVVGAEEVVARGVVDVEAVDTEAVVGMFAVLGVEAAGACWVFWLPGAPAGGQRGTNSIAITGSEREWKCETREVEVMYLEVCKATSLQFKQKATPLPGLYGYGRCFLDCMGYEVHGSKSHTPRSFSVFPHLINLP